MATPLAGAVVGALFLSLVLLLPAAQGGGSMAGYVPVPAVVCRSAVPASAATAEAYEPFELCLDCRCCPAAAAAGDNNNGSSSCVQTRCCYGINCNIPGKPFGFCAFTPRTCGCGATGNCTNPAA